MTGSNCWALGATALGLPQIFWHLEVSKSRETYTIYSGIVVSVAELLLVVMRFFHLTLQGECAGCGPRINDCQFEAIEVIFPI